MSGRKQHYIPQSVLRAFETPSEGTIEKVWVYKRGQQAYISSIKDAAAERHFYSELANDGSTTLDDEITAYENKLTRLLVLLREAPVDNTVDATIAAELITHLSIRGAYLRDVFGFGAKKMITELANIFSNENHMRALWGIDTNAPTPLLQEEIDKMVSEQAHHLTQIGLPESLVKQIAFTLIKENFHSFYAEQSPEIVNVLNKIACNTRDYARNGHVKALGKSLVPEPRLVSLCQFSWELHLTTEGKLILPDCVVVVVCNNDDLPEPYMMSSINDVNLIMFPICPNKLLVGHREKATLPEAEDFNEAAAVCSHTFFISAIHTPELEDLAERIGERSKAIVLDAVSSAVTEFTTKSIGQEHRSQSMLHSSKEHVLSDTGIALENQRIEINDAQKRGYPVIFRDCAEQEAAQRIAIAVDAIVSEMSDSIPFERLDCIIFAEDYVAALRDLERGFPTSKPLVPTEEDWAIGVAMAPLVVRNGITKVSIIMRAWLGYALISEDHAAQTSAIHILVNQLAHVTCVDLICQTVPEILLNRVGDEWETWLYVHMHSAWTAYFASRISADYDHTIGDGYRDILLNLLEKTKEIVPRERLAYRSHGDLYRFLESAITTIGTVMTYAGMLLGHCDGLGQSVRNDGAPLMHMLENMGLQAWIDVFQQALAGLYERRGKWESAQEFLSLNRHIERVLWQFGVFPWRNNQGEVRVEIPISTDIARFLEEESHKEACSSINEELDKKSNKHSDR